jgi:tight adherence protein B
VSSTLLGVVLLALGAGAGVVIGLRAAHDCAAARVARPGRAANVLRVLRGPLLGVRLSVGLAAGIGVLAATRWPVAAAAVTALSVCWPLLFGATGAGRHRIAQLEALAMWTESLKDLVGAATGLHEAIPASVETAPPILVRPLGNLTADLAAREPLPSALRHLAAELADPTADLVIAAMLMNLNARGPGLSASLGRLAESIREELDLRRRIEAVRRGGRRNVQIMIAMVLLMAALMTFVLPPQFSHPYRDWRGELVLTLVIGIFGGCFAWMRRAADADVPDGFVSADSAASS